MFFQRGLKGSDVNPGFSLVLLCGVIWIRRLFVSPGYDSMLVLSIPYYIYPLIYVVFLPLFSWVFWLSVFLILRLLLFLFEFMLEFLSEVPFLSLNLLQLWVFLLLYLLLELVSCILRSRVDSESLLELEE